MVGSAQLPALAAAFVAGCFLHAALSNLTVDVFVDVAPRQLSDEHAGDHDAGSADGHASGEEHEGAHHGEGHHSEGHHGEGHHHVVADDVTFTVSVMLFMFLTVDMVLLYFVNNTDPNIRQFAWSMLGTTISIFCAVLLNEAARSFFLEQILPAHPPRGFNIHVGHKEQMIVGTGIFAFCFSMLSISGWKLRHDRRHLFAVKGIGGHITGFAFIASGGHWQELFDEDFSSVVLVTLFFYFICALLRFLSMKARDKHQAGYSSVSSSESGQENDWIEMVMEGEDECFALAMGFLISQVVLFSITGELQPMHGVTKNHTMNEVHHLILWVLACLVLLVVSSNVRSRLKKREDLELHGCTAERVVSFAQHLSAFTAGWLLLKAFEWMMSMNVKNMALGMIINAFVVTMISVVAIILLDCCADRLQEEKAKEDESAPNPELRSQGCADSGLGVRSPGLGRLGSGMNVDNLLSTVHGEALDKSNHARSLRTIMDAFSFLTGLSWEKAFDSANATLVVGVPVFNRHVVISKIGISVCLVILVLPAWLWYVVPKAMRSWKWHEEKIQKEKEDREQDCVEEPPSNTSTGFVSFGRSKVAKPTLQFASDAP